MSLEAIKKALVINYFLTEKDNSPENIALLTGISEDRVNRIITKYLHNIEVHES